MNIIGRLVDKNYKPFPKDYQFSDGEKVIISEDAFCCYSIANIKVPAMTVNTYKVVYGHSSFEGDTWIVVKE